MVDATHRLPRVALFRLEFGGPTGWGHLVRSGALACELRRRGWTCALWTASPVVSVPSELLAAFEQVHDYDKTGVAPLAFCDWLVLDHYGTDDGMLRRWRASFRGKILVIDDDASRRLDAASIVVNVRPGLAVPPYAPDVPALLGERYALLRPDLGEPISPTWVPAPGLIPVLVMMGGTDPAGATTAVLDALAAVDSARLVPVVVRPGSAGPGGSDAPALRRFPDAVWLDGVNARELAGWAGVCRFAVSAAGGTLFELAALRLPFVSVVVAENQRLFAAAVEARWGMRHVTVGPSLRADLADAVHALEEELESLGTGAEAFAEVDLHGAERVAAVMEP